MAKAKHAYVGTMRVLQELGLNGKKVETVDEAAEAIVEDNKAKMKLNSPTPPRSDEVLTVNPNRICNWQFHDRPPTELGDIDALANDLKLIGQQQPCIVRPYTENPDYDYEVIAGERRWRAASKAGIQLKVIVKPFSDNEAALSQAGENAQRKDLSDFAKGMSIAKFLESGVLTQSDLTKKLGLSKIQVNRLMSFSQVPEEIWEAVSDMSNVSARTATEIRALANKGKKNINALITLSPRIRSGKLGARNLRQEVENLLTGETKRDGVTKKITNENGVHMYTLKVNPNNNLLLTIPSEVCDKLKLEELESLFSSYLSQQLS